MGIIARAFGCRRGFAYCVAAIVALLALLPLSVGAQTSYPVQVNVMVTPPSSVYLTDYYTRGSEKLKVQLLLKEVSRPSFPVKLRFRIEGPALRLTSRPGVNLPPFVLQGGSMVEAAGDLLAPYLSLNALVAEGADAQSFQSKGQRMADGFYKVEAWAEEMGRSVRVSNVATTFISTMLFQSPIVTAPADRSILSDQGIQNIIFQWMPRHLGASLDIAQGTYYKVRLVEVWPSDRDPQEAIRSSKPLYEGLSTSTSFVYGAGQPTLISGRKYALQVQALDADQRDLFTGMGYSNVVSFTYGEECQQPQGLNVEVGGPSGATVLCSGNARSTGYTFAYRKVYGADTTWQELPSGVPFLSLDGLTPVTSYRVRVAACCGTARSLWTQPRAFTTLSSPESKFECGKGSNAPAIIDRTPAGTLRVGDKIKAADFTVVVVSASAGANGYSGQGIAQIPFLRNVPAYCLLKDVKVNKELQLVDGSIVLADSVTVVNREIVKEGTRLGNDLFSSLKDRNSNSTVIVTPVSGTITSVASTVASSSNEVTLKGETSKVEVVTSSGQATTSSPGSNSMVVDEAGNTVSVSKNGTATKGRMDKNAFGSGATSSDAAQLASGDSLPKVTFTLDTSKEHYGYDATSLSGEQWVSVKTGSSVAVTASIQRQRSSVRESDIRYRTSDGLVVDAAGTNPATLTVKGLYSGTPVPVLAVADTGKVDSLKKAFICGRIGTVGYDLERRRVWLVPINGAKVNRDAVAKQLNDAYRQAVVEWDVQYDPSLLSVTITDEELRALCSSKDVGMLSNYTLEQQTVLKKFGREPEERTYIMFMVPCKSSYAQGMMPLNRSAGFVFMEGQTDDAVGRTVAHELGHGAFGLEHVGNAKDGSLATTNNLMDYANGTTLDKNQWDAIHSDYRRLTWFQGADEGAEINLISDNGSDPSLNIALSGNRTFMTPSGKPFTLPNDVNELGFVTSLPQLNIPAGALVRFKKDKQQYYAIYIGASFQGYSKNKDDKDYVKDLKSTYSAGDKVLLGYPTGESCVLEVKIGELKAAYSEAGLTRYGKINSLIAFSKTELYNTFKEPLLCLKEYGQSFYKYNLDNVKDEAARAELFKIAQLADELGKEYFEGIVEGCSWNTNYESSLNPWAPYFHPSNQPDYTSEGLKKTVSLLDNYKKAIESLKKTSTDNTCTVETILALANNYFLFGQDFKYFFDAPFRKLNVSQKINIIKAIINDVKADRSNIGSKLTAGDIFSKILYTTSNDEFPELLKAFKENPKWLYTIWDKADKSYRKKVVNFILPKVLENFDKLDIKPTTEKVFIAEFGITEENVPVAEKPVCIGLSSDDPVYIDSRYQIQKQEYDKDADINFENTGGISFKQKYSLYDGEPRFIASGTIEKRTVTENIGYTLQPFELVTVYFGRDYNSIGIEGNKPYILPALWVLQLYESADDQEFNEKLRKFGNYVAIGSAFFTYGSTSTLATFLTRLSAATGFADNAMAELRGTKEGYEANKEFFEAWEKYYISVAICDGAVGLRAIVKTTTIPRNLTELNAVVKAKWDNLAQPIKNAWNGFKNLESSTTSAGVKLVESARQFVRDNYGQDFLNQITQNGSFVKTGDDVSNLFASARQSAIAKFGKEAEDLIYIKFNKDGGAAAEILDHYGTDGLNALKKSSTIDDAAKELVKDKTLYRAVNETSYNFDKLKTKGIIEASPAQSPTYVSLDKFTDANTIKSKLQLPKKPTWVAEFDGNQIISDVHIPNGKYLNADYKEVLCRSYPNLGEGGGSQFITNSQIKLKRLINLETGEVISIFKNENWVEVLDIRNKINVKVSHVIENLDINATGTKFTGCHSEIALQNYVTNNPGTKIEFRDIVYDVNSGVDDASRVFEAKPVLIKADGTEIVKGNNQGVSSFFPKNWDKNKILDEVEYAIANNHGRDLTSKNPNEYFGFSRDGKVEIHFYYNSDGSIGAFFPKKR